MKVHIEIEGLLKFTGELELLNQQKPEEPKPEEPKPEEPKPEEPKPEEPNNVIEWAGESMELEGGKIYYCPDYKTISVKNKSVLISKKGKENAVIIFGRAGYSDWDLPANPQPRFLFDVWENAKIVFDGVDPYSAAGRDEVQPFFMTVFRANRAKNQHLELRNLSTNMGRALAYSAGQEVTQKIISENVEFEGIIWEELKANSGGGLAGIMRNCQLKQVKPRTYFEASLTILNPSQVKSSTPFARINNQFNSEGNSCNILYVAGLTFYLPDTGEAGEVHSIRPIPLKGESVELMQGSEFLRTTKNSLQAGDVLNINGVEYPVISKDRPRDGFESSGYAIDLNIGVKLFEPDTHFTATVIKSAGAALIGQTRPGYMAFKYNKHFHTNIEGTHTPENILSSVPFGVLSYNHEEVTFDYENVKHDGFYRQSRSNVGHSNGYRFVNCEGYADQFAPPVKVITE